MSKDLHQQKTEAMLAWFKNKSTPIPAFEDLSDRLSDRDQELIAMSLQDRVNQLRESSPQLVGYIQDNYNRPVNERQPYSKYSKSGMYPGIYSEPNYDPDLEEE